MSDETRRLLASRKSHMGVVTRKGNEFDKIKTKPTEEITADDRLLAETLLESLTGKRAKILDATETSDEALDAEIFKLQQVKSLMKSIQKWIAEHTSDVGETSSLGSNHRDNVSLPRIELPSFDGQYKDWKTFFDMFKGTVHEQQSLPKVQKIHYLKGALKGEAKRVLSLLPTTEANYDAAIQLLKDRYDNEFLITKAHLYNIFKIDSMKKDSADSLRKLIGIFNENEMFRSALGIDTKS